jgi:predicted ATPase
MGETPQLFPVLWRLVVFYFNRGEHRTAHELAEQMMRLAQSLQDPYLLSYAHMTLGWTLYLLGELTSARSHLEQTMARYDPQTHPRSTFFTTDPRVECLSCAAWTLWYLGYPDQALKRSQEALDVAAGLSHPFGMAYALAWAALFHLLRRDELSVREQAEAVITLATEQGFSYWVAFGTVMRGGALAEQGQVEEGITQMQQGLAVFQAMGTQVSRPHRLVLLAKAYGMTGQVEKGLTILAEGLAMVDKNGERYSEAELYRVKGELTLQKFHVPGLTLQVADPRSLMPDAQGEAEICFLKAIEVARKQQAKSRELRAATSLARFWQQGGKRAEDHNLLSKVYNWFTEGFDTKDLQEAKALIEELSQ